MKEKNKNKSKNPTPPANKRDRKPILIASLGRGAGIRAACRGAKISPETFYKWRREDPDFAKKVDEVKESRIEIIEDKLYQKAERGQLGAICVVLFNRAPDRWKNTQHVEANVHAPTPIAFVHYDPAKHAKPGDAQPGN